jgi:RNA polymerase sigma-70 factor (ECF subfamily)
MEPAVQGSHALDDFEEVVRRHWSRIFRFALVSLRDRNAAESVAQDCFLKAYKARDRFRGEASLNTWLMQIAVNLIRDHARSRRLRFWTRTRELNQVSDSVPDGRSSPESNASAKQKVAAVWSAMAELPEKQRTVFLLRFVEDMDLLEIAAATGLKEGTVKTHLFRALQTVRKKIG